MTYYARSKSKIGVEMASRLIVFFYAREDSVGSYALTFLAENGEVDFLV